MGHNVKTLSIAETRRDFCSLASDVIKNGETIIISRYGAPSLMLMRYEPELVGEKPKPQKVRCKDTPGFGMWADREDMADPRKWIEEQRAGRMKRMGLA
jgi:hypothetical protein